VATLQVHCRAHWGCTSGCFGIPLPTAWRTCAHCLRFVSTNPGEHVLHATAEPGCSTAQPGTNLSACTCMHQHRSLL